MKHWLARLQCRFMGHLRKKRTKLTQDMHDVAKQVCLQGHTLYQCPRCKSTWTRKVSQRKAREQAA